MIHTPYWLIEKSINGVAHWWIRKDGQDEYWDKLERWTTDSSKARHYPSKVDAEFVIGGDMIGCVATEHIDCGDDWLDTLEPPQSDRTNGLYVKYHVHRIDGSSAAGGKHYGCDYFVLDMKHDKHAKAALLAYAESCKDEYPLLATDLRERAKLHESAHCQGCDHEPNSVADGSAGPNVRMVAQ